MPKGLVQLTIFASGTSETQAERSSLRRVVEELNKQLERTHGLTLKVRSWPDDVRPGVSDYSQAELNRQLGNDYDIYLGVMGSRFGTPTPNAGSGTEEEFVGALARFRADTTSLRVLFYFKRSGEDPFRIDPDQLQKAKTFRESLGSLGVVYRDFQDTSDFVQQTKDHIYSLVVDEWSDGRWRHVSGGRAGSADVAASAAPDSDEAEGVESDDDGYLERLEQFHESAEVVASTFTAMTAKTARVGQLIQERTESTDALSIDAESRRGAEGNRAEHAQLAKVKEVLDLAAADLNEYSEGMADDLNQYRTHSRRMFMSFRLAFEEGGDLWNAVTRSENVAALRSLVGTMNTVLGQIGGFQASVKGLPPLTGRFKRARNKVASTLGELIAEITFAVEEATEIISGMDDESDGTTMS